jgi:Tfp pilus assembly protein PilO
MSSHVIVTTPEQATRNRAFQLWGTHLGVPAWVAVGLIVIALLLQFQVRPAQERARAALVLQRAQVEQAASAQRAASATGQTAARDPMSQALPEVGQRGQDVGMLLATAKRNRLTVERADYTVESVAGAPLSRLHANLPVSGSYADLRMFIAEVLNAMPNATLESLQLERADTRSPQLQATLRVVLFYRTAR